MNRRLGKSRRRRKSLETHHNPQTHHNPPFECRRRQVRVGSTSPNWPSSPRAYWSCSSASGLCDGSTLDGATVAGTGLILMRSIGISRALAMKSKAFSVAILSIALQANAPCQTIRSGSPLQIEDAGRQMAPRAFPKGLECPNATGLPGVLGPASDSRIPPAVLGHFYERLGDCTLPLLHDRDRRRSHKGAQSCVALAKDIQVYRADHGSEIAPSDHELLLSIATNAINRALNLLDSEQVQ
jgi:hypothetical protein